MKIKVTPTPSKSLREALLNEGFRFPCGGKGVCGRCKILAPMLAPTELDHKFFTAKEILEGNRLACDKSFDSPIEIDCFMQKSAGARKLSEPMITAILGDTVSEISIIEDGIVETLILPSPMAETVKLRGLVGKNAVELYEKYGVAKASVILVAGTSERMLAFCNNAIATEDGCLPMGDTLEATLFDMPSEEVYLPPFPNAYAGSLELLELDALPQGSLLVFLDNSIRFLYKGESTVAVAGFASDYPEAKEKALIATLKYYNEVYRPIDIYLIGNNQNDLYDYLNVQEISIKRIQSSASMQAALAVEDNRYKTRLNKLSRKVCFLTLADDERWQELFSLS